MIKDVEGSLSFILVIDTYLRLFVLSGPFDMRKVSDLEIHRNEERYSKN